MRKPSICCRGTHGTARPRNSVSPTRTRSPARSGTLAATASRPCVVLSTRAISSGRAPMRAATARRARSAVASRAMWCEEASRRGQSRRSWDRRRRASSAWVGMRLTQAASRKARSRVPGKQARAAARSMSSLRRPRVLKADPSYEPAAPARAGSALARAAGSFVTACQGGGPRPSSRGRADRDRGSAPG